MQVFKMKKGLSLPITGAPKQQIHDETSRVESVAIIGPDYPGMKPTMLVKEGENVSKGQPLFQDKKTEGVLFTSPAAGKVASINRGAKRAFESVIIECSGKAEKSFAEYSDAQLGTLDRDKVVKNLVESGLWTSLRQRPYGKVPSPQSEAPKAIFVRAMDTEPLGVDASVVLKEYELNFNRGLRVLSRLTDQKVYVCVKDAKDINPITDIKELEYSVFKGPHPAGLSGTHIHFLRPANKDNVVWYLDYQDTIAIGKLFTSGELWDERIISVAGPLVKNPRLVKTKLGANLNDVTQGDIDSAKKARIISGSVLSGRNGAGNFSFLGKFHHQVSVIEEDNKREFLGWQGPGFNKFSIKNVFAAKMMPGKLFDLTSTTHGSPRAMVPIGMYEKIMPLDMEPTFLLRAILTNDLEMAEKLGALELDEEDLALCTFVDPGKVEYGPVLRKNLEQLEKGL